VAAAADFMKDDTQADAHQAAKIPESPVQANNGVELKLPAEPFPCPHCGQMLGPDVRICAACRQAIDPSQIAAALARVALPKPVSEPARARPTARFSWSIFLIVFLAGGVVGNLAVAAFGLVKGGFVVIALEVVSSAWVSVDARQKGIPRPLRWSLGSLLLWILFFPWYLARRRQPEAVCPLVENRIQPFVLVLVSGVLIQNALAPLVLDVFRNYLPK
jgi:predicted RNA-binding Zn-ribbon protein involved in translation (DUF1610 family)